MSLRDLYLRPPVYRKLAVATPEWQEFDGKLSMRELSEAEWLQVQEDMLDRKPHRRALLVARALIDEQGNRVLTDADAEALANQPAAGSPVARLFGQWHEWHGGLAVEQKKS